MQTKILSAARLLNDAQAQQPCSTYGGMTFIDACIHIATTRSQFQIGRRLNADYRDLVVMHRLTI